MIVALGPALKAAVTRTAKLRLETSQLQRNLTKRAARVVEAGFDNNAIIDFEKIKAYQPKNDLERKEKLAALKKLNRNGGLSVKTAAKAQKRDVTATRRQETEDFVRNNRRSTADAADTKDLYNSTRRSVAAKVRAVKKKYGSTPATDAFDEWEANRQKNPNLRTQTAELRRLLEIRDYQGISVKGADLQHSRGVAAFGEDYDNWTKDEQGAAWQGFRDLAEKENRTISSDLLLAEIKEAGSLKQLQISFYDVQENDGRGGTRMVKKASVGRYLDEAQQDATHTKYKLEKLAEMRARSTPARLF